MLKGESVLIFRELNKYIILSIGSSIPLPNEGTDFTNANTFAYALLWDRVGVFICVIFDLECSFIYFPLFWPHLLSYYTYRIHRISPTLGTH
jgi:hypothetical protein